MRKPIIGILGRICFDGRAYALDNEKSYVASDYIDSVIAAGGVPVILPVISDEEVIKSQIGFVDGVLVPGGEDVNPLIYGEEPDRLQGFTLEEMDHYDIKAVKIAYESGKPILGICRGIQVINAAFGGTLYQDLSQIEGCRIKHDQEARKEFAVHTVEIKEGTKLYDILGKKATVNSYHHQAVKDLAPEFEVSAYSVDGVIEAIEIKDSVFLLAVQWHPEAMVKTRPDMQQIFKKFVDEAGTNRT